MRYDYIIEVCKDNPYRDPKTGRFTFAPGNRGEKVSDADIDVIMEVTPNRTRWTQSNLNLPSDISRLPTLNLPDKERKMLESELNTNLSKEELKERNHVKTVGLYTYTFECFGYDCYRFVDKRLAKSIVENAKEEK